MVSATDSAPDDRRSVALLTLGCARNEVDSEELAARLHADGWRVTTDGEGADVVVVNTCGFVEKAKRDSIQTVLAAADTGAKVVAAGCLAERYGRELAEGLPEAQAVLSFDDYPQISQRLDAVLAGEVAPAHTPRDRRNLLPLTPVDRRASRAAVPGHGDRGSGPAGERGGGSARERGDGSARERGDGSARERGGGSARERGGAVGGRSQLPEADEHTPAHLRPVLRHRLDSGPVASLKLASGCDRRCAFCAIPAFRGAFISRDPEDLLAEAEWLARRGVRELVLVSENSTSYGKDLGDPRLLEKLLPQLAATSGIVRVRVSYLQPAETRPGLVAAIAGTPGVAPYFDLSFQHSSEPVLRRMRRFGSTDRFLELLASVRELAPEAGVRSNFIVGFPGETRADVNELVRFLSAARLDAIGVFDYSDEDGTEAAGLPGKVPAATVRRRYARFSALADELCSQRAEERLGSTIEVLVDSVDGDVVEGRAAHQAPEVDGSTTLVDAPDAPDAPDVPLARGVTGAGEPAVRVAKLNPGDLVRARVVRTEGVDLVAVPSAMISGG